MGNVREGGDRQENNLGSIDRFRLIDFPRRCALLRIKLVTCFQLIKLATGDRGETALAFIRRKKKKKEEAAAELL